MMKNYLKFLLFSSAFFALSITLHAQKIEKQILSDEGIPTFVKLNTTTNVVYAKDANSILQSVLNTSESDKFKMVNEETDALGINHQKFQQYYNNVKVEYATYTIHSKSGIVNSLNGEYINIQGVKTKPALNEKSALEYALKYIDAEEYMWENPENEAFAKENEPTGTFYPKGELVIVRNYLSDNKEEKYLPHLAYKFNIYAQLPLSRNFVFVDAETGKILHVNAIIKHFESLKKKGGTKAAANGTADTRYSGTRNIVADSYSGSYRLRDYSRGNGMETYNMQNGTNYNSAVDFTDNNNNWTSAEFNNSAKDNAALDAHWAAEMTYDYFLQTYNRNSFDNNGAAIKSYVHFNLVAYGYPNNDNAFWDGTRMTYGDGTSLDPLTTIDIAAHEIGHAVCTYTANLNYSNESGALNEGFSDIWGASVEYFAAPEKNTWILGEDLGTTVRSLENPNVASQPDTYGGTYWYTGTQDNGGVHTNSGVINHWFYILSVGKSGTNDNGNSFNVSGIGIAKAAAIAYRTESVYLTANSQYADTRTYAIQSATDLYGAGSNEVIQTTNAWYAVGVGNAYGQLNYCTSKGNNSSYEWISNVTIGSFSNNSGAAGYTDFTGTTVSLNSGQTYSVSLTPGFSGSTYNEYFKIWIDYNADGDFSDANELVFDAGAMSKTTVTGNMSILSSANGSTRMRVSMKYNGASTECETFSYGEVEDYTVSFTAGGNVAPTANANGPYSGTAGQSVSFSSSGSNDPDGTISSYSWNFGDGGTSSSANPSHTYSSAGTYTVTLTVTDNGGLTGTDQSTASISASNVPPTANANGPYSGTVGQAIAFSSTGSSDPDGSISSYSWNFGDGSTSTSANPSHSYSSAGTYTATLTVTDNGGLTGTDQATVTVSAASGGNYASLPYSTGFESGLDQNWSTQGSNSYSRIQVTSSNTPHSGSKHLTMDVTTNGHYCTNEAWMGLNLSGKTQVDMSFWWKEFGDETHSADGVYFSDNGGSSFVKVYDLNGSSYTNKTWNEFTLDVDQLASSNGLSLTATFVVKFQQYDNYAIATDGFAFDDISVSEGSTGGGTTDPPTGYCASKGNNSSYEWIDLVQLGSINNSTGNDGGYADYTGQSTNVVTGTQYTIYFSTGFSSSSYTEYWKVFIDFNRDGDFADSGEEVVAGSSSSSGTLSSSFTVPSNASIGYTRMRVSMKYNAAPTACETFTYGEVEDYLVNIGNTAFGALAITNSNSQKLGFETNNTYTLYPNPANELVNVRLPEDNENISVKVLNATGAQLKSIEDFDGRLDVSELPAGLYTLIFNDGNKIEIRKLVVQ